MKKIFRVFGILLLCCGLLTATGCNKEYKPKGDYSQFDVVYKNIEPPDRYGWPLAPTGEAFVTPAAESSFDINPYLCIAITGKKLSSVHYYSKDVESPFYNEPPNQSTMEGYGFTLTRIQIETIWFEVGRPSDKAMLSFGKLKSGDIITVREPYTYRKNANGEPEFYLSDDEYYDVKKSTVQKEQEYLFILEGPKKSGEGVFLPYIIEKMDDTLHQFLSEDVWNRLKQQFPNSHITASCFHYALYQYRNG